MKGLGQSRASSAIYLNIIQGKIAQKVTEHTQGAVERENKNGHIVYEMLYECVYGFLVGVSIKNNEALNIRSLSFRFENDGNEFCLDIPMESRYATDLSNKLSHLVLGSEYTFAPFDFETEGAHGELKRRIGITIYNGAPNDNGSFDKDNKIKGDAKDNDSPPYPEYGTKKEKDYWKIDFKNYIEEKIERAVALLQSGSGNAPAHPSMIGESKPVANINVPTPRKKEEQAPFGKKVEPEKGSVFPSSSSFEDDLPF